jgi:Response regulator of the LytR/AlgR family
MWVTLKVRVEKDASLTEPELIIRTPTETPMIEQLKTTLEKQLQHQQTITAWLKESQVYVPVDDILFLESADRHVIAHTIDDMYTTHDHLYELEQSLSQTVY